MQKLYAKTRFTVLIIITALIFAAINASGIIGLSAAPVFAIQGSKFTAKLTGQNEVPPKDTKATGSFEIELSADGRVSNYVLNATNIRNVTLAHIHEGEKGVNGPIIVTLYKSANANGTGNKTTITNGTLSQGKVYSKLFEGPFAGKYISDLMGLINDGKAYVNIHTKQNPQGEIRGQLSPSDQQIPAVKSNSSPSSSPSATVVKELPKSSTTTLGTESEHKNNWITANHDIFGTRNSNQTIIGKNNVNKLQVKWIFHSDFSIENPPLIVGDRVYIQDNGMRVMALDVNTGLNIWKYDTNGRPAIGAHGLTYDNDVIFAGTGSNATVVAINATDGKLIWQSTPVGPLNTGYSTPGPPTVWKDIVIVGQAFGDIDALPVQGKVTAFNRTNGEKIWSTQTTVGSWVEGKNATINGGAATWSGGALDPKTGIYYVPTGNSSPNYNDTSRPDPNLYSGSMLAVNASTGHIVWAKQLVPHNTKDHDAGWGLVLRLYHQ